MTRSLHHLCSGLIVFFVATNTLGVESKDADFFESRIRPVLVTNCYECHSTGSKKLGGELLLDSRDHLRQGGESGVAIEPGKPTASLLLEAIRYEGLEMPPAGKLPDHVIADFEEWIRRGAFDPRDSVPEKPRQSPVDIGAAGKFWSFRPPRNYPTPTVKNKSWARRKIDPFVLVRLEERGLQPSAPAKRAVLIRRLAFDLLGLPPSPAMVEKFCRDTQSDAYEQLVDRLLAAPQFGERWARLWLDVARYAEDQAHIVGKNDSLFYPNAYLYRNWLIAAFNEDLPYDRFVKLQLAADLIEPASSRHQVALGFLGLGPKYYRRNAPEVMADEWEDRVDTTTRGFLGLTVACARCHDHKYDPIPTIDYYALAGVFASTEMFNRPLDPEADQNVPAKKAAEAMHVVREGKPQDIHVQIRGDAFKQGEIAPRQFLQVLSHSATPLQRGSGREQLADAIARDENPLTARVIVNRVWAQYFGAPLVGTPSNFGSLGSRPTHPELLDDLAVRFMRSGWSLKWLHREIVMSAVYRQSSSASEETLAIDPANELLGRMSRRRLSVEMWRDAMLCATGELQNQIGGPSLDVSDPGSSRRSVYSRVSRLELNSMLQMFDFPDPNVHAAHRSATITPLQKLFALNSDFMVEQARRLVARLDAEAVRSVPARIERAYELVYSRKPKQQEQALAQEFLQSDEHWVQFAQVLFASNEMMHLD